MSLGTDMESLFGRKESFKYPPQNLRGDEIRLVILHPRGKGDKRGLINCEIIIAKLSEEPIYEALSYTWGLEEHAERILISNCVQRVRPNLWQAFNVLQNDSNGKSRYLWIDALCINQNNVLERDHQVTQMGKIYEQAQIVLAWLGPGDAASTSAMRVLSKICGWWDTIYDQVSVPGVSHDRAAWELAAFAAAKEVDPAAWQAILDLCCRGYWTRLWIIQEIVLAKDVLLLCGESSLPWVEFSRAFTAISFLRKVEGDAFLASKVHQSPAARLEPRRGDRQGTVLSPHLLYDLFLAHRKSQCADPRDKIFGLQGLAKECCKSGTPVDYTLSPGAVCGYLLHHQFTHHQIQVSKADIIHHLHGAQQILQKHSITNEASSERPANSTAALEAQKALEERLCESVYISCSSEKPFRV
jgi:Heterokaryon incompatibility protein (HET)